VVTIFHIRLLESFLYSLRSLFSLSFIQPGTQPTFVSRKRECKDVMSVLKEKLAMLWVPCHNSCKSSDSRCARSFKHFPGSPDSSHPFSLFSHGNLHLGITSVSLPIRCRIVLAHIVQYHSLLNYWYVAISLIGGDQRKRKIGVFIIIHHPASTATSHNPPHRDALRTRHSRIIST